MPRPKHHPEGFSPVPRPTHGGDTDMTPEEPARCPIPHMTPEEPALRPIPHTALRGRSPCPIPQFHLLRLLQGTFAVPHPTHPKPPQESADPHSSTPRHPSPGAEQVSSLPLFMGTVGEGIALSLRAEHARLCWGFGAVWVFLFPPPAVC